MRYEELENELIALGTSLSEETTTVAIEGRDINLMVDSTGTYLYAYAGIRELPEGTDRVTLRSLLALNTMGKKTEGGHLGLIEGSEALLYSKRFVLKALAAGSLEGELKAIADAISRISEQADRILRDVTIETEAAKEPSYDALSVTSAISFGWIQA